MAEKRENSVLFSLRELKNIEEDRVKEEHDDRRKREDDARAAKEAEERAQRDAAERARRDAEDAERRRFDEVERQKREEALRLEEAERKARVEGQMKLEEARLKMEIEAQAVHGSKKKPTALLAISGILVVIVAVGGFFAYNTIQENEKKTQMARAAQAQAEQDAQNLKAELDRLQAEGERLDKEYTTTLEAYKNADEAQKKALDDKLAKIKAEKAANTAGMEKAKSRKTGGGGGKTAPAGPALKLCPPGQPIC